MDNITQMITQSNHRFWRKLTPVEIQEVSSSSWYIHPNNSYLSPSLSLWENGSHSDVSIARNRPPDIHGGAGEADTEPPPFLLHHHPHHHSPLQHGLHRPLHPPRLRHHPPPISFHHLPPISPPLDPFSFPSIEAVTFELLRLNTPNVRQALRSISLSVSVAAFIIDLFSTPAFSVGADLNLPTFYFFTSGASCLACYLYLPTTDRNTTGDFKDMNTLLHFPSLPPIPSSDMPLPMMERRSVEYNALIDFFVHMPKSDGIIVNTFESLEPDAVKAIQDGLCVPDAPTPPVFCVGPLIASDEGRGGGSENVCLRWLDSQPSGSVVFLCFGSLGSFSVEQLAAMAVGLERSGQRFLWVVRSPPDPDKGEVIAAPPEPDLDSLLPDGFLERTKERGLVVKSWAPQVAVLRHDSVGGFVTHCGWNSVLEAVCAGVPMVAWPLYAEQRLNRVLLVEQMKLALSMNESDGGFVTAAEVEERVRELMESEAGKAARERAKAAKEGSMAALSDGGSSLAALAKLVESWKRS